MRLGVLSGFLTGAILSGLALAAASYLTAVPGQAPPEAVDLDVPAGSEFKQSREDTEASLPGVDDTPEAESVPKVAAPVPDDLSLLEGADVTPASQPETGSAEGMLGTPRAQTEGAGVDVDSDEPVLPSPQSLAPKAPEDEEDLSVSTAPARDEETSISTEPAQPAMPEVEEDSGVFQPEAASAEAQRAEEAPAEGAMIEEPPAQDDSAEEDMAAMDAPEEEEPSGTIGNLAEGVTTGRLPSVIDEAAPEEEPLPPLQAYAAPFENPGNKPLMAIVLIDDGSSPISHEALADFPYPISYAVDADWPGAAEAAAKYRAAGLEVLAMADLPAKASARDAEVAMQAHLNAVPEAVAVMEGTGTGLQSSREATEQLIPILQDSGHGLVLFSEGLDTAQKLIAREGVPVVPVFRDFDAMGQSATVIRRFLDQAAFKAGQEEAGVVMVGRLRAETVSALLLWGLQDRAASVALAPVSAVLRKAQ